MSKIDVEKIDYTIDEEVLSRFFREAEEEQSFISEGATEDFLKLPLPECYINRLKKEQEQEGYEEEKIIESER